jgi:DNA-directed RNA polymerase I subunit RPA2
MEPQRPPEEQYKDLYHFLAPHIESFNWAATEGLHKLPDWILPQSVQDEKSGDIITLRVKELSLTKPHDDRGEIVYPYMCRLGGTTYGGSLQIKFEVSARGLTKTPTVIANDIPIMVNSKFCHLNGMTPQQKAAIMEEPTEAGGYFIYSGYEKLLRLLILNRQNYVFALNRPSFHNRGPTFSNFATSFRSVAPDCSSVTTNVHYQTTGNMVVLIPLDRRMFFVPLPIILRALVEVEDTQIYQAIVGNSKDTFITDRVIATLKYASEMGLLTRAAAREYLGAHFRNAFKPPKHLSNEECCEILLQRYLFPHLSGEAPSKKFDLLIFMTRRLLQLVKGNILPDNMDANSAHELLTPGTLWLPVISDSILGILKDAANKIYKDLHQGNPVGKDLDDVINNCHQYFSGDSVSKRARQLFSTGSLNGSTLGLSQTEGLSIIAERINYCRYLAHFRSVHRGAFFTTMKTTAVRYLLPESWGFMCPVHTPDGGLCGLLTHLARFCEVVTGEIGGQNDIIKILYNNGMVPFLGSGDMVPVIVDGRVVGSIKEGLSKFAVDELKKARREGRIPEMCEIADLPAGSFTRSIYVFVNQQRMMRPIWNNTENCQEFVGPLEQIFMEIGARPTDEDKPYREIHETSMLSLIASLTPFSDYNQSPRNMYQCQMAKQTMGYPMHREAASTEVKTYHVHYPQRPIVRTTTQDSHALEDFLLGTNACVAVLSYTGYDMEDALLINKCSVERGFGHGCIYKTHRYIAADEGPHSFFCNTKDGEIVDPDLDADGLPFVGQKVTKGCKLLRVFNPKENRDHILTYKDGEDGYIDKIITTSDPHASTKVITSVVIKFRMVRTPTIGDKFSSRHGQKGVFSFPWPQENMPFCENGITPDVIINPHAFPSRMTIGMLIESMCGKLKASQDCSFYDATPFTHDEKNRITDEVGGLLAKQGFDYYGNETMFSGITGEQFKADIFMGVVYYQRLRHMVGDKYQVRATGKMNNITRQPLKGRKKGGGIRLGEMERDGLLAQGVTFLIRDRFMWCSDGYTAKLCNRCGSFMFTQTKRDDNGYEETYCSFCKKTGNCTTVYIPYVLRYLCAEFAAMNIRMKFDTKDLDHPHCCECHEEK